MMQKLTYKAQLYVAWYDDSPTQDLTTLLHQAAAITKDN